MVSTMAKVRKNHYSTMSRSTPLTHTTEKIFKGGRSFGVHTGKKAFKTSSHIVKGAKGQIDSTKVNISPRIEQWHKVNHFTEHKVHSVHAAVPGGILAGAAGVAAYKHFHNRKKADRAPRKR